MNLPSFEEIEEAAGRLERVLAKVPLFESEKLNRMVSGRVLVKAETLQPTGSFKIRGAWNRLAKRTPAEMAKGILALSSGNHGRAVAWAAREAGVGRTIVLMPKDAPSAKVEGTRELGATVISYDRRTVDRAELISRWERDEGLLYVPAFDDRHVIAGAGTIAFEAARRASASGLVIDDFVAACSGGGLVAGSILALRHLSPASKVWGVEPEAYDDTAQSIERGERVAVSPSGNTICDALLSLTPGKLTFSITRDGLAGAIRATDEQARLGMRAAFAEFGLVAEPSGALALGAVLSGSVPVKGRTVLVVLSGRNVDPAIYASQNSSMES